MPIRNIIIFAITTKTVKYEVFFSYHLLSTAILLFTSPSMGTSKYANEVQVAI